MEMQFCSYIRASLTMYPHDFEDTLTGPQVAP